MPGRQEGNEVMGLEDKAHLLPAEAPNIHSAGPAVFLKDRLAVKDDFAGGGVENQAGAQEHGGLAGTAGSQQGHQVSGGYGEINILQGPNFQAARPENLAQAFDL